MKIRFFILPVIILILILVQPACEKDNNDKITDPKLNYRPTQRTSKMNGEYWDRKTFTYESDRLIIVEDYDIEFGNSELNEKLMFEYPDEITIVQMDYDMTQDPPESDFKSVYTVNEDRITEILDYYKGLFTDEWELLAKSVFTYISDQLTEEKNYWYEVSKWEINKRKTYNYENNKVTEVKEYYFNDTGTEELMWEYKLEYEGDKISQILTYYKTNPMYKRIPEYEGDRIISAITYMWTSGTWESYYKNEYEYDDNGNCIWEKEFYFETNEEYIDEITYEKGKSNYYLLMEWPGSERYY